MKMPVLCVAILTSTFTFAAEPKPVDWRVAQAATLKAKLDEARKSDLPQRDKNLLVKSLTARLQSFKAGNLDLTTRAEKGDVGTISRHGGTVLQVLGGNDLIVETQLALPGGGQSQPQFVWLSGISTEGVVDDAVISMRQPFECLGTKQYESLVGTSTVLWLKPFVPPAAK